MKKILFFAAALGCGVASAQDAPNKNEAIVQKVTATWCGPCGSWGWDLMEEIIAENSSQCMVMSMYSSASSDLYNSTAGTLDNWGESYPNWGVNNLNRTAFSSTGGIFDLTTKNQVKAAVDSFALTAPVASTGFFYDLSGTTMTVTTNTKFWQPATGDYYLTVYIIEDSVVNVQNTNDMGMVSKTHHNVLRGSMTTSAFGDMIATGSIAANTQFPKTFTYNASPSWNVNHLKTVVALWKANGSGFDFVNANQSKQIGTSVSNLEAVNDLQIYPNPASHAVKVSGTLVQQADAKISLINMLGQTMHTEDIPKTGKSGSFSQEINLDNLSSGMYQLRISTVNNQSTRKLIIAR